MDLSKDKTSWQDKRIRAMDRFILNVPVSGRQDVAEYFTDEYVRIITSKAKNKKESLIRKCLQGRGHSILN